MKNPWQIMWREVYGDKLAFVSLVVFFAIVFVAYAWSLSFSVDDVERMYLLRRNQPPCREFWLGTDMVGRDMVVQLVVGARNSFTIAFVVSFATAGIGIFVGLLAGVYGGRLDNILMRVIDFFIMLPTFMVTIVLITMLPSTPVMLGAVLTLFGWLGMARGIRMVALRQSALDYVRASKTLGTPNIVIIFREVLPNIVSFMVVSLTLTIANTIGIETGLTFLGFGMPFTTPSLGTLIAQAANPAALQNRPWQWLPAALLILVVTMCINYVGQALNRAVDVKRRRR
ncbi:MAG: ABC transporter permease [Defluviitaleaceae bacterium]|nr:ABC transporter permease [Defluviitaleaceae bacterium]